MNLSRTTKNVEALRRLRSLMASKGVPWFPYGDTVGRKTCCGLPPVARTVAELSDVPENEETLFDAGVLEVLVKLIAPSMHQSEARLEAVRAMSSLSSNENAKKEIVGNAALGHLISLSKSGKGLEKMYALATLTNLAHDTAALRIQMAFRGFVARKNTKKKLIKQAAKK